MPNQHGLSRNIPADVKRSVRQRCGYGCVVCGGAIIEYEHIDPPFAEATSHDPAAIALLCPRCHSKVTRGFMSKDTVQEALAHPAAKARGYANELFDLGHGIPQLVFAGATITNTPIPIEVSGIPLFEVEEPEEEGAPFRFTGNFFNSRGQGSVAIVENEWRAHAANWDVEATGGVITIRDAPDQISLRLRASPPNALVVEQLDMIAGSYRFRGNRDDLFVQTPGGGTMQFTRCIASNCRVGFSFG
jgi:hypothetical protein